MNSMKTYLTVWFAGVVAVVPDRVSSGDERLQQTGADECGVS